MTSTTTPILTDHGDESEAERRAEDRRLALVLGFPSLALALCLSVLSTYLPVLARQFTSSSSVIGLLIGAEGVIAVLLPIWVGRLSDRTSTRMGRRLPFLLVMAPIGALSLSLLPFAPSLLTMSVLVGVFYIAYFSYFSPFRALYPDLISSQGSAKAQGVQGVFSGVGVGIALVGGGLLLALWRPLPYLAAGAVLLIATAIVTFGLGHRARRCDSVAPGRDSPSAELIALFREHKEIRYFVVGNALITLGLSGLKSFVVLWLTEGLQKSMHFTVGAMIVVAAGTVVGAGLSGWLADRYGPGWVLRIALFIFGGGMLVGTFTTTVWLLAIAFPAIALAGGAAFALPYAYLLKIAPNQKNGIVAGLFDASSGVGTLLGPSLTGIAIDILAPFFPASHGYSAMWPVLSCAVVASAFILVGAKRKEEIST